MNESARFSCVLRAPSATEIAQFCGWIARNFACKILKFNATAATDARTRRTTNTDGRTMHTAHDAKVSLSSAMRFAAEFCIQKPRFSAELVKFSMSFGAIFARNTRPALAKTSQKVKMCATRRRRHPSCFCARLARFAHVQHRNCVILRSKIPRILRENF